MTLIKPKLIIFDLDYTLWPFRADTHIRLPFRKIANGDIVDSIGNTIKCYPNVSHILNTLYNEDYFLAVASRSSEIKGARELIKLFGWDNLFAYIEIFPGKKIKHINRIKKQSGISLEEMIFFDDDKRNIRDLDNFGVISVLVKNGVTEEVVKEGLLEFSRKRS